MDGKERLAIKITRSHCLGHGRDVEEGVIFRAPGDLTIAEAKVKIATGYAVEVPGDAAPEIREVREPVSAPDAALEVRDPGIETRDPEVKPATRKPAKGKAPAKRKPSSSSKGSRSRRGRKGSSS